MNILSTKEITTELTRIQKELEARANLLPENKQEAYKKHISSLAQNFLGQIQNLNGRYKDMMSSTIRASTDGCMLSDYQINQTFKKAQKDLLEGANQFFRLNKDYSNAKADVEWALLSRQEAARAVSLLCKQQDPQREELCRKENAKLLDIQMDQTSFEKAVKATEEFFLDGVKAVKTGVKTLLEVSQKLDECDHTNFAIWRAGLEKIEKE